MFYERMACLAELLLQNKQFSKKHVGLLQSLFNAGLLEIVNISISVKCRESFPRSLDLDLEEIAKIAI